MSLIGNGNGAFGKLTGAKLPANPFQPAASAVSSSLSVLPYTAQQTPSTPYTAPPPVSGRVTSQNYNPTGTNLPNGQADQLQNFTNTYTKALSGDSIYNAQLQSLNAQLQGGWGSGVIPTAQQAEVAYGAGLPSAGPDGTPIDYKALGYSAAPTVLPTPGQTTGASAGQDLFSALSDYASQATNNPYSQLAQIQAQQTQNDATAQANAVARGLGFSGVIGQHQREDLNSANQLRNTAQGNFLSAIGNAYNSWLGNLSGATDKLGGYQNDLANRVIALIQAGMLTASGGSTPPSSPDRSPAAPSSPPVDTSLPQQAPDTPYSPVVLSGGVRDVNPRAVAIAQQFNPNSAPKAPANTRAAAPLPNAYLRRTVANLH